MSKQDITLEITNMEDLCSEGSSNCTNLFSTFVEHCIMTCSVFIRIVHEGRQHGEYIQKR